MKQMKTLEQIKDEVAKEHGFESYSDASRYEIMCEDYGCCERLMHVVVKRYAQQVAEDTRQRCAENATIPVELYKDEYDAVDQAILNTEIILP